jgi:translation elongation factor EF-G
MDAIGADFEMCLGTLKEKLGVKYAAIQYPIGKESGFIGEIDLVRMVGWLYTQNKDDPPKEIAIPDELKEKASSITQQLLETSPNTTMRSWKTSSKAKSPRRQNQRSHPQSHDHREVLPGALRHRVQG